MDVKTLTFNDAVVRLDLPGLDRNLFSSRDWIEVIYKTYRSDLYVKYIERDGKVASYIIYCAVKNFLEWKICICSYCDYCDCHVERGEDWRAFFNSLREDYPQYRVAVRNLRDEKVREVPELKELNRERYHRLDVRDDLETLWRRTTDSFRAAVNQGNRNGIQVKRCGKEDLPRFYDVHLNVRRHKHKVFPQPYRFFDIIWEQYVAKDKGVLLGAFDPSGRFIGGNIYLICGNTLYYKFNTSAQDKLKLRPNNVLFWEGVKFAKERNLQYIDLGSSGYHQDGLILFKKQTGADMSDIIHLGFHPEQYKFSEKRILRVMTWLFTQPWMPDFMIRWGSRIIYPYLA